MSVPLDLLLERLRQYDEVQLCELLEVSSEDLVDRFIDRIKAKKHYLSEEMELLEEDDGVVEEEDTELEEEF